MGYKINRKEFERTWGLAWVSVISQLGFVFADANLDDPESVATLRKRIEVAFKNVKKHWAPRPKTDFIFYKFLAEIPFKLNK